jgi:predicted PurR-regulated permease PerM
VGEHRQRLEISISVRTLLLGLALFFLGAALVAVRDALLLVFVGVFLAAVFEHPTRGLMARTRLGRGLAATVVVLGSAAVATVLGLILLVPLVSDLRDFVKDLPELVDELRESDELGWVGDSGVGDDAQSGAENVAGAMPDTVSAILGVVGEALSVGLALFTVLFVCLFFLLDVANLRSAVASVLGPAQAARTIDLWERITRIISRWAIGALVIAVIAGTVQGTTAWILGSSYALALGLIAGFFDLIPNIGATIAGFILTIVMLAEEGLTAALIMLAVVLVYQQVENNLLTPTIQGKATNISGFFVITGVTVFGALLGVLGALIAVPVVASLQIVAQELTKDRRERMAAAKAAAGLPPDADPSPAV